MKRREFFRLASLTTAALSLPTFAARSSVKPFKFAEATIDELRSAMRSRSESAVSIIKAYVRRIKEIDQNGPKVNSVIEINPDAIGIARKLDLLVRDKIKPNPRGPLHGI